LLVDVGTVWIEDVEKAAARLEALKRVRAVWLEEPFVSGALDAYRRLAELSGDLKLAGGEACHTFHMARQMIDHAAVGYVQIDAGRIGGLSVATRVADYAAAKGVTYVNHTFTSHLALSASLQPYAGIERDVICEYPVEPKALAWELTKDHLLPDRDGQVHVPERPGLGLVPDEKAIRQYLVQAEIIVNGRTLYRTPTV
jgi:L-alanine-DL-glutamate epimerase-like enolase superfamily enzyme